jgi:RNA polymerase sigma-70 factor, ECF subfamily
MDGESTSEPPWDKYRAYLALIARILLNPRFRHKVDPSDVAQEAVLKAYQMLDQYQGRSEAERRAWLRMILTNTLKDHYRAFSARKRNIKLEQSFEATLDQTSARLEEWLADSSDGPEAQVLKEDLLDQIARAIDDLPENLRTPVELHYIHGYRIADIAREMGISQNAVGARITRGVIAVRERMNDA